MDLREVLIEEIRDVGRDRERSIAITVLWMERMVEWKAPYGEDEDGANV